jgi:predicted permease
MDAWREHTSGVRDVAAYLIGGAVNLTGVAHPQQVVAGRVTASFFRLFGARLAYGRAFTSNEDRPGGERVVVLSYGFWQRQWGGDRAIIGQAVSVNGDPSTIVGVLDRNFDAGSLSPDLVALPDIWMPLRLDPDTRDDANNLLAAGRLEPGVPIQIAEQEAEVGAKAFRDRFPGELPSDASFRVVRLKTIIVGDVRPSLLLLFGAVGLVTLIMCANTANLLLGRASARQRELAIRTAVGASRGRLVRQLLTESILLSATGGSVGCVVAAVGIPVLLRLQAVRIPRVGLTGADGVLNVQVLLFMLATSIASGIASGLAPAMKVASDDVELDLRAGVRVGGDRQQRRVSSLLLLGETSIACVLVIASVLLIRSFADLRRVDPGFDRRNVLTMRTAFADERFATTAGTVRVIRSAVQRLTALPGIEATAVSLTGIPLEQGGALSVNILGRRMDRQYVESWSAISPGYFSVFKIPLIRGRMFTDRDERNMTPVAIINEAMARQLWPNGDPFRDRVLIGQGGGPAFDENVPREIVGIVADVRQQGLNRPPSPGVYVPIAQVADPEMAFFNRLGLKATWAIRTRNAPNTLANSIARELLRATDLPPAGIRTMDEVVDSMTAPMALNMWLMTAFGTLALLLAVVGIYAIAAYSVHQRTRELGIRLALGAKSWQVRKMVIWESMRVALTGVVIGMAAAGGLAGILRSFLFGVAARDPMTFTIVPLILAFTALVGVWLPARRAARVDPIVALRSE